MTPTNLAVWGVGPHALKNILPAIERCDAVRLRGVCSRNSAVVAETSERLRCTGWTDAEAMLADTSLDAVYLATPTGLHWAQGQRVLEAGKQLWCEKPLAENAEQADALVTLSRSRRVVLAEAFMYLYHPQFDRIRRAVGSGELGTVHSVACRFGIPPLDRSSFRTDPALGGGAFLDVGAYPFSAFVALFPDAEPDILYCERFTRPGSAVDTSGRVVLRYGADLTATAEWRYDSAYRNEIDIWGTEASLVSDRLFSKPGDYVPRFRLMDRQGRERVEESRAANHFVEMLRAFHVMASDPAAAESERQAISRRAGLAQRIRKHSSR